MPVAFVLLALAILSVWWRPFGRLPQWPCWLAAAIVAGLVQGWLTAPALLPLVLLAALAWHAAPERETRGITALPIRLPAQRAAGRLARNLLAAAIALGLALHVFPGFHNPVAIDAVTLGSDTPPYTQYLNFDKGAAGLLLLAGWAPRTRTVREAGQVLLRAAVVLVPAALLVFGVALLSGHVRIDPKWPAELPLFLVVNLLFTVVAEEAFFRGLLQEGLARRPPAGTAGLLVSLGASALLFGLAHVAGGPRGVLLATLAGLAYAGAYAATRRIEAPIAVHAALNALHFVGFSYPWSLR